MNVNHSSDIIMQGSELQPLSRTYNDPIGIAQTVNPIVEPVTISESIKASNNIDLKSVVLRVLAFFSAAALGVLTGLAIAGTMVTPVGWAIAGAVLLIVLIGAYKYGGFKELFEAVKSALVGFGFGFGSGMIGGGILAGQAVYATTSSVQAAKAAELPWALGGLGAIMSTTIGLTYFHVKNAQKNKQNLSL